MAGRASDWAAGIVVAKDDAAGMSRSQTKVQYSNTFLAGEDVLPSHLRPMLLRLAHKALNHLLDIVAVNGHVGFELLHSLFVSVIAKVSLVFSDTCLSKC